MATTGIIKGRDWILQSNTTQITHLSNVSLSLAGETIDVTSYDSSDWKDFLNGDKSWTMDASFHMAFDAAEGIDELAADWNSNTSQTVKVTTGVTGDTYFSGSALITSISIEGDKDNAVSCSISYQGTGALTIGVEA